MESENKKSAQDWFLEGCNLQEQGELEKAIECYGSALEINPNNAQAWINMSKALYELGKYEETINCVDKALELEPENADYLHYREKVHTALEKI